MSNAPDMADRHREILTELSTLGLAMARDLQARALAAADDQAACDLSLAFQRISRSLRQTLALEARLERDRRLGLREDAMDQVRETRERVLARKAQVRVALSRLIWTEAEGEEAEDLLEELESRLVEAETLDPDFAEAPLEACVARIRADLNLSAANTTAPEGAPAVVIWKSSG